MLDGVDAARNLFCGESRETSQRFMTIGQIATAALIYIALPLAGLCWFILLCRNMHRNRVPDPPVLPLLILICSYGGLLMMLLTALFWEWSGMATLGLGYLVIVAPVLMGVAAYQLKPRQAVSPIYRRMYRSALAYYFALPIIGIITAIVVHR